MASVNDVVLLYLEDAPVSFARIESILPDAKKDWYHIQLLMLQIPLQVVTWILKDDYINGLDFHMNGKKMKLEKVVSPMKDLPLSRPQTSDSRNAAKKDMSQQTKHAEIISFSDLKKKNHDPESG